MVDVAHSRDPYDEKMKKDGELLQEGSASLDTKKREGWFPSRFLSPHFERFSVLALREKSGNCLLALGRRQKWIHSQLQIRQRLSAVPSRTHHSTQRG